MSKVIVIEGYRGCPYANGRDGRDCWKTNRRCPESGIPDWCPLPDLPDYKPEPDRAGWTNGEPITEELTDWLMDFGYNQCLQEILGEEEE